MYHCWKHSCRPLSGPSSWQPEPPLEEWILYPFSSSLIQGTGKNHHWQMWYFRCLQNHKGIIFRQVYIEQCKLMCWDTVLQQPIVRMPQLQAPTLSSPLEMHGFVQGAPFDNESLVHSALPVKEHFQHHISLWPVHTKHCFLGKADFHYDDVSIAGHTGSTRFHHL